MEVTSPPHVAAEDQVLLLPPPPSVATQAIVVPGELTASDCIAESNQPKAPDAALAPVFAELEKLRQALETQSQAIAAIQQKAAEDKKELSNSILRVRDDLVPMNDHLTQRLANLENNFTADVQAGETERKELADVSFRLTTLETNFTAEVEANKAARDTLADLSSRLTSTAEIVDGVVSATPVDDARLKKVEKDIQLLNVTLAELPPRCKRDDAKKGGRKQRREERTKNNSYSSSAAAHSASATRADTATTAT